MDFFLLNFTDLLTFKKESIGDNMLRKILIFGLTISLSPVVTAHQSELTEHRGYIKEINAENYTVAIEEASFWDLCLEIPELERFLPSN